MEQVARPRTATALAILLAPMLWGTTYLTITETLPSGRPLLVAAMRVGPAGLVLVALARLQHWSPRSIDWGHTALLAVCNFVLFFPLLAVAVYRLPGGVAAAVGGLQPFFVATLSWWVNGVPPTRRQIVIGAVAMVGVAMVVIHPGAQFNITGLLAAVAANLSFSVGVVLTKRFPEPTNRLGATGCQLLLAATALYPLTYIVEGRVPLFTPRNTIGFAYLSMCGTALAFVLWFNGIRKLPPSTPPLLGLAAPVTGAILGWVVLSQALQPLQLFGLVVTCASIAYGALAPTGAALTPPHRSNASTTGELEKSGSLSLPFSRLLLLAATIMRGRR